MLLPQDIKIKEFYDEVKKKYDDFEQANLKKGEAKTKKERVMSRVKIED